MPPFWEREVARRWPRRHRSPLDREVLRWAVGYLRAARRLRAER